MKSFRWSDIPRSTRRKPQGETLALRAREREASREKSRRDYEKFQQAAVAKTEDTQREAKARCAQRIEEYLRAVEWAAAYEKFEKMDGWNGDRIEEFIN